MWSKLESFLWQVRMYLWKKCGIDNGERIVYALEFWIRTDRISINDRAALLNKKPYCIGRILIKHDNASIDETIEAIKKYIR